MKFHFKTELQPGERSSRGQCHMERHVLCQWCMGPSKVKIYESMRVLERKMKNISCLKVLTY